MRSLSFSLVALSLSLLSGAGPSQSPYKVHEKRTHLPAGWRLTRSLDATSTIPLWFALKQKNIEEIETYLYDVSHPRSSRYGRHWSAEDIASTFAPTDETINTVRNWLGANGIPEGKIALGRSKGWIRVNVTIDEAEQLMRTKYRVYTHTSGTEHVACEVYHLPEHVQPHIDFVTPSVHFDARLTRRSNNESSILAHGIGQPGGSVASPKTDGTVISELVDALEECANHITPMCLRTLYGLFYEPVATHKNSYGIVEYTPQAYLQNDLEMFARHFSTDLVEKQPYLISIDGGYAQTTYQNFSYNAESGLDLQYAMSLVTGNQTVTLYQAGDMFEGASFNNFLDAIDGSYCAFDGGDSIVGGDSAYPDPDPHGYKGSACGTAKPTYVISTSYGYNEADLSLFYAQRQCAEYAKLGLMGVTILYSSGDSGVAGNNGICLNANGTQTMDGKIFNPIFPATCPYITSVGATMLKPNATVFDPASEMACMGQIYSSGGFSNYFALPAYQKDAVNNYLTHHYPQYPSTIWNSTGTSRGYPDISANGANYIVAVNGVFKRVSGTSCSAPVSGAIFTMINDARLAVGKGPIGFINPTIYSEDFCHTFHDITEGTNPGCGTAGFNATAGWDPVTGLGTLNFPELLNLWLVLP